MTVTVISVGIAGPYGRQGDTYAIPSKRVPLPMVEYFAKTFLAYARNHPDEQFTLTVLEGYKAAQTASFFDYAPANVALPYKYLY